jgi:hypothetical protein
MSTFILLRKKKVGADAVDVLRCFERLPNRGISDGGANVFALDFADGVR